MQRLVAIVGPTAIGKSRLAIYLAHKFNGEIVSADSRQIYRYMDIGTAKPSPEELSLVPHHLISIINPNEDFSLVQYLAFAKRAIADIQQRDKLPFLVGGSGQYIWALLEGWKTPPVPPDNAFRQDMEQMAANTGSDKLYQQLRAVDPAAAEKIDPHNVRRVIRALEVYEKTNVPISQLQKKEPPQFAELVIGLTMDREGLHHRIDQRADEMVEKGLVSEVTGLLDMGYDFNLTAMSSIGYKQIGMFLRGELTLPTAIEQIKFESHRFVRNQYNWFRAEDGRIRWFDIQKQPVSQIESAVGSFVGKRPNQP